MKLSVKLGCAMGTLSFFIFLVGAIGLYQMNAINKSTTVLAAEWLPATVAIEELNTLFSDYRIAETEHVFCTDADRMKEYEKKMDVIGKNFSARQKDFEAIPMSAEAEQLYKQFSKLNQEYEVLHQSFIKLSRENKTEEAISILNGRGYDVYIESSATLLKIVELNVKGGTDAGIAADNTYKNALITIITILSTAILFAIVLSVFIIRNTLRTLGKDPDELGQIAKSVAAGNLQLPHDTNAVGVYADIRVMVENLKENIDKAHQESDNAKIESSKAQEATKIAEVASTDAQNKRDDMLRAADKLEQVANIVSSASTELSAQIEQSERGASEQASRVTETATAMEQMNSTVLEVAKNAGEASEMSTKTRSKAEEGAKVVQEAMTSIQDVQKSSITLKSDMAALSEQAQSISQIMGVISDIADQTNLLALNAAIEAARAGEAGRGFAVVADEVRKLAEKTMVSTTDVGNAIRSIQSSTEKSMQQVESTVKNIEQATSLASRSGDALREIVLMVDGTADQVRAIATASEEQSAASEQINRSILQVNSIASETARAMQESAMAVSDLANQAQVLTSLIEDMKQA